MSDFTFEGFEPANTTPVPDVLFDELLSVLSGTELKVLLYIIRRTLGFKKTSDGISLSQFTDGIKTRDGRILDQGCGIKKRSTVSKVLQDLIKKGCVESEKGKTDMGDDAVTIYRVHFKGVVAKSALPSTQTSTTVVPNQPLPGGVQTATTGSADLATHKKQLARNSKQETVRQEGTQGQHREQEQPCADAQPAPVCVSHPEHPFLWFDDLWAPTSMVIRLTPEFPHPHFSEFEDKRRMHIAAYEVQPHLRERGLGVTCRIEHETGNETTVDAPTDVPYQPNFNASQRRGPLTQFFEDAIASAQQAGVSPIATTTEDTDAGHSDNADRHHSDVRVDRASDCGSAGSDTQPAARHAGHDVRLPAAGTDQASSQGRTERGAGDARTGSTGNGVASMAVGSDGYQKPAGGKRGGRKASEEKAPEIVFTVEGQKVYDAWASLFKSPPPVGPQTINCANALYGLLVPWCHELHLTCSQLLDTIQKFLYKTDKNKFYARGVTLCDVYRDFEKWQSAKTRELNANQPEPAPNTPPPLNDYSLTSLMASRPLPTNGVVA